MGIFNYLKNLCGASQAENITLANPDIKEKAQAFLQALGGKENISNVDACITRLRVTLVDRKKVNEVDLKRLGSKGNVKLGEQDIQIILGTEAKPIADTIKTILA